MEDMRKHLLDLASEGMFQIVFKTDGAVLPTHLLKHEQCTLNFSHRFDPDDLAIGSDAIEQTLSFDGNWFKCRVPLANIVKVGDNLSKKSPALSLVH